MTQKQFLSFKDLEAAGYVRGDLATLKRRISAGQFPRAIRLGKRYLWNARDVEAWVTKLIRERDAPEPKPEPYNKLELATADLAAVFIDMMAGGFAVQAIALAVRNALTIAGEEMLREANDTAATEGEASE